MRIYLDYNIYNSIQKDNNLNQIRQSSHKFYLSVNHVEEFYKACQRDKEQNNREKLEDLKNIMILLSPNGILNPQQGKRIINKKEKFEDCLFRIKAYNTQKPIESFAKQELEYQKGESKKNLENDMKNLNNSNLSSEKIWSIPIVQEKIKEFQWEFSSNIFQRLEPIYGFWVAMNQSMRYTHPQFTLHQNMYGKVENNFQWLETVIEYLDNILCECCYNRDNNPRKAESGIYDVAHLIYATYCEYFVTLDKKLLNRAQAIYYYLGAETKAISYDVFKEELLDS